MRWRSYEVWRARHDLPARHDGNRPSPQQVLAPHATHVFSSRRDVDDHNPRHVAAATSTAASIHAVSHVPATTTASFARRYCTLMPRRRRQWVHTVLMTRALHWHLLAAYTHTYTRRMYTHQVGKRERKKDWRKKNFPSPAFSGKFRAKSARLVEKFGRKLQHGRSGTVRRPSTIFINT